MNIAAAKAAPGAHSPAGVCEFESNIRSVRVAVSCTYSIIQVVDACLLNSLVIADADRLAEGTLQTMFPRGALDARTKREKRRRTRIIPDAIAGLVHTDPAKARVMAYFRRLVADGYAEWQMLENGDIRLRFRTGETYLLASTTIIRIA
ncbi:hypothetical protein [Bradyrhizobium sp. Ai1a-2]|uniref:hypothetical protein n=1 Tax=Bradyrhizobium sp. Ai1a-2 TaxID=196490 RepID=UPI0005BA9714|nr:hypothetical protein [Bradyrhizobium sp. Ai1a-2]